MNGRFFDGRKLEADFYDGYSNYYIPETDEEKEERDKRWEKWLEGNEEYDERMAAEKLRQEQDAQAQKAQEMDVSASGDRDSTSDGDWRIDSYKKIRALRFYFHRTVNLRVDPGPLLVTIWK